MMELSIPRWVWLAMGLLAAMLAFYLWGIVTAEPASAWSRESCYDVYHSGSWWERCWVNYSWWEEVSSFGRNKDHWKDFIILTWGR